MPGAFDPRILCGTPRANTIAASLMKLIKTPPPPLLRARFATVLDHLPSVPSVVLPTMSLVETDRALLLLKPMNKRREIQDSFIIQFAEIGHSRIRRLVHIDSCAIRFFVPMTNSVISSLTKFVWGA